MADTHFEVHFFETVRAHKEGCLQYAKRKSYIIYDNPTQLALDYGKYGTDKFFPLSQLAYEIKQDARFEQHIRQVE